jgi:hypothetical protein
VSKFEFQGYAEPARWLTRIYRVKHVATGTHLGSVARGIHGWVVLLDEGGIEPGFQTRTAAAERLLVLAGLNPVAKAALPDDPFDGLT